MIAASRARLRNVTYSQADLYTIAELTAAMEVDGHRADIVILKAALAQAAFDGRHRADIVILKAALAQAAFDGRTTICEADILLAAELALPHRLRRLPFDSASEKLEEIHERIENLRGEKEAQMAAEGAPHGAPEKKTS